MSTMILMSWACARVDEFVEVGERAETGVDVAVVDDVVAAVAKR